MSELMFDAFPLELYPNDFFRRLGVEELFDDLSSMLKKRSVKMITED